jgi:hypothetical protein
MAAFIAGYACIRGAMDVMATVFGTCKDERSNHAFVGDDYNPSNTKRPPARIMYLGARMMTNTCSIAIARTW